MLLDEAITRYLNDLTVRRGPYSVRNQTGCLQTCQTFLGTQHPDDHAWTVEEAVTLPQCRAFMATLAKRGLRPKTLKGYVIALRGLIRFLHDDEALPDDWSMKIQGPRVTERRADPLTQEEWQHFLNAIPGLTPAQLRDRLFFQLLLDTGLRLNEIISLSLPDIRLDQQLLIIRHGENDKDRTIPLTEVRSQQLKAYLDQVRPAFVQPTSPPNLFSLRTRASPPSLHHPGQGAALCATGGHPAPRVPPYVPRHLCHPLGLGAGQPHRDSGVDGPCEYPDHSPVCGDCRERDAAGN